MRGSSALRWSSAWFTDEPQDGLSHHDRSQPLLLDEAAARPRPISSSGDNVSWRWIFQPKAPVPVSASTPSRLEDRLWAFRRTQPAVSNDAPCMPALPLRFRVVGFATCFILGTLLSLGSISAFSSLIAGNPAPFAFQFSIGNLLSMLSTGFIVGFRTQARSMTQEHRALSAALYVLSMIATIFMSLAMQPHALVVLICIAVQYGAMIWYIASYVPFGRSILSRCCQGCARSVVSVFDDTL
jgi:hypothetical protein